MNDLATNPLSPTASAARNSCPSPGSETPLELWPRSAEENGAGGGAGGVSVKTFRVEPCDIDRVRGFVEKWHYSHNTNGIRSQFCFRLMHERQMIGAAIFGGLAMANQWKAYSDREEAVIELRRLCCIDDTPKNTESFFIGKMLRSLARHTKVEIVVSYADPAFGHEGTIYKASNFERLGLTSAGKVILHEGKRYHDKCVRTKYRGQLKPFAAKIKAALESGEATTETTPGKVIFVFRLGGRRGLGRESDVNMKRKSPNVRISDGLSQDSATQKPT